MDKFFKFAVLRFLVAGAGVEVSVDVLLEFFEAGDQLAHLRKFRVKQSKCNGKGVGGRDGGCWAIVSGWRALN